jgi:NAD+ kinase
MITIHVWINEEFINSYWADGLIISTPTGSTAYSLSVGGPIVAPDSSNFIITPLAPHNLTVRPLVIPDHNILTLKVEGRSSSFMASLDFRSKPFNSSLEMKISRADFTIRILKLENHSFYSTLRNKLMWGIDKRN